MIYELEKPLAPGELLQLNFNVGWTSREFRDGNEKPELAYNGTFFDSTYFPSLGYVLSNELDDPRRRREEQLGSLEEMTLRGDPVQSLYQIFTRDSDWISYHTIVTTSGDQIAIAPGYLKRQWTENGRNCFEYDMGSTKILDFYSYLSAQYKVRREQYKGTNLEIYYTPGHEYDIGEARFHKGGTRLLSDEFQPVSVSAIPYHGIPALSRIRPVVLQYGSVFRGLRLYPPDAQEA